MAVRLYYYPDPDGTLEEIDLTAISRMVEIPERERVAVDRWDGGIVYGHFRSGIQIRVTLEQFNSASLHRELFSLQAHLERGGRVGVAQDSTKAWCGYLRALPPRGSTVLRVGGDAFYEPSAALADGDEVVIESSNPEGHREMQAVSGAVATAASSLTLSSGCIYNYEVGPAWVRHRNFYPVCVLPANAGPIIQTERRLTYTLDMTLRLDMAAMSAAEAFGTSRLRQSGDVNSPRLGTSWSKMEEDRTFDARGGLSSPNRRGSGS